MSDLKFYRFMISKRAAVMALTEINKALHESDMCYFWHTDGVSIGSYDRSVYSMAADIKSLVNEVKEYRALKKALKPLLSR